MWPILICSILGVAIILEKAWSLRQNIVAPDNILVDFDKKLAGAQSKTAAIVDLAQDSVLGRILGAGIASDNRDHNRMKEAAEEAGRREVHELERYLNTLGTIAATTPLLGLLGTVIGMIKVFSAITAVGVGDPQVLAGGISEALITTAAGLSVGIPCLMAHRYFRGRVNELAVTMEQQASRFLGMIEMESES